MDALLAVSVVSMWMIGAYITARHARFKGYPFGPFLIVATFFMVPTMIATLVLPRRETFPW